MIYLTWDKQSECPFVHTLWIFGDQWQANRRPVHKFARRLSVHLRESPAPGASKTRAYSRLKESAAENKNPGEALIEAAMPGSSSKSKGADAAAASVQHGHRGQPERQAPPSSAAAQREQSSDARSARPAAVETRALPAASPARVVANGRPAPACAGATGSAGAPAPLAPAQQASTPPKAPPAAAPDSVAKKLQSAGFSIAKLMEMGYSISELREAGFSATHLRDEVGLTVVQLRDAGFTAAQLSDEGITSAMLMR